MANTDDLIDRDIACGNGCIGKVTRQIGTWKAPRFGDSPIVNVWLAGEVYRHVRAVEGVDGLLEAVDVLGDARKGRVA